MVRKKTGLNVRQEDFPIGKGDNIFVKADRLYLQAIYFQMACSAMPVLS